MKSIKATDIDKQAIFDIESCIEAGNYKEALASMRESESTHADVLSNSAQFLAIKARVLNLMGDYISALDSASNAYRLARADSDNDLVAKIQTESAKANLALGKTEFAQREYRDVIAACKRSGNISGIIDTLNRMAQISFINGDFSGAENLLSEALDYAQQNGLSERIAKLTGNLGQIANMTGKFDLAVEHITESITKNSELKAFPNLCRAYLSLAYAEMRLGNFDSARKSLQRARGLIEKHNLTREYGIYHEYLAELEYMVGAYDVALEQIEKTLEHGYKLSEASALISQGERLKAEILAQLGREHEARGSAEKALQVAEEIGEKLEAGAAKRVLAEIYAQGKEFENAREHIYSAIDLIKESRARYDLARAYISAYMIHKGNVGESRYYLQLARELYSGMNLEFNLIRSVPKEEDVGGSYEVSTPDGKIISIVTSNRRIRAIMRAVDSIKDSDIPILIEGETGTGKDQLAKYIHYSSKRRSGHFIPVNCAAIPHELAESELFGHVRGAFTNAVSNKEGLIAAADGGTLFLNEIGELSPAIQAKLLGVLENKKLTRIGDLNPRNVDFRLICATNRDLEEEVRGGSFRQDLYFRIAVMTFELPPLAQRGDDIFDLIAHFLKEYGFDVSHERDFASKEIRAGLRQYDWPGNIRELRNEVNLLALSYPGDTAKVIGELAEKLSSEANQSKVDRDAGLAEQISAFERDRILEALAQADYVIRQAAVILKMPEATLRSKIKKHNIILA
ncbi:MAG: AAA domain-containing protein [candidate division Zixibacteria bacterium]|nr:AAA domain-containing protein [candidate division Zixibacteria bacterium]NIR67748.1 AAA domain-containing protein [candidate division Zixibacteria bacterium]NIS16890.1 AAA domain-containing protein [candidate division Zixibacteria bacterium]NIS49003.1 AAA domain-containing protein [candidate division Zixibacteria bacterium]NIT53302.1 AAA domain-containing protein [candidate division Zixibacteria bacterium]